MTTRNEPFAHGRQAVSPGPALRLLLLAAPLLLVACGGGGGDQGQSPDPLVEDFGIAYVKRPAVIPDEEVDVRDVLAFSEGADLFFRDLAAPSAREVNLTRSITRGLGDVKDVDVSFDGRRLLFAMRMPDPDPNDDEEPTWNIWEFDLDLMRLRRVIASDLTAEAGEDFGPAYLPDGRIIFSSTRQRRAKAMLLDDGKPQYVALTEDGSQHAAVLHVMNDDGSEIRQVSFNQSHDLDPVVMRDGRVVFSRWDNAGGRDSIALYRMRPDGSEMELLYGARSQTTGTNGTRAQLLQAREWPRGGLLALLRPDDARFGGDIVSVDTENYVEYSQPVMPNVGILSGPAQSPATVSVVYTDGTPSPGGRFSAVFPLWDGTDRALVSWSQCRLQEPGRIVPCTSKRLADPQSVEAPPLYGLFVYDFGKNTQRPIFAPQEGAMYTEVVATAPRRLPNLLFDKEAGVELDAVLADQNAGMLHIRSVHDVDGAFDSFGGTATGIAELADPAQTTASERPVRFVRLVKAVSLPDDDVLDIDGTTFGTVNYMREILGYAPVQPDGSVRVKVPADVPFLLQLLDADGRRIGPRHRNWMQVKAGDNLTCNGCHDASSGLSHGRSDSFPTLNTGAAQTAVPFPNTVPALVDYGDTMAEVITRMEPAREDLSVDLVFDDPWTDDSLAGLDKDPVDPGFRWGYASLGTPPPVNLPQCVTQWQADCRITINYVEHIQPMWDLDRGVNTCTACHTTNGGAQTAEGQLELTATPHRDVAEHLVSYRELLFTDFEEEFDAMLMRLVDVREPVLDEFGMPVFETDADGNLVLDADGNPIPVTRLIPIAPTMRAAGARASSRFFDLFAPGGTHNGRLTDAELKLLSEWLDIGGQYYNNPFAAPN